MGSRKLPPALRLISLVILVLCAAQANAASISDLLTQRADDARILPVEEAFSPQPAIWQNGQLSIAVDIAPGCYLYRDRFSVEAIEPAGYALGSARLPKGEAHHDEHFGDVSILRERLKAGFTPKSKAAPKQVRIRYQGCAEGLVCYPPQTRVLTVETLR